MRIIASYFVYVGRVLLVVSLVAQAVVFSMYPSIYYKKESFASLIILVLPTLSAYGFIIQESRFDNKPILKKLWIVWGFYVSTLLIPIVGLIFGGLRERLDYNQFFWPNILKITMCGSAVIALLLVSTSLTTRSDNKYKDIMIRLCWNIAMDLFDDIEILEMILPQKGSITIPVALDAIIIACVFLSFVFSIFEMYEQALDEDQSKNIHALRLGIQMFLVNVVLLVIRLIVWLKYKHDASIFIAKNIMKIWISILEILKHFGFYDDEGSNSNHESHRDGPGVEDSAQENVQGSSQDSAQEYVQTDENKNGNGNNTETKTMVTAGNGRRRR